MSPELAILALAGLWQGGQYVLMAVPANLELGTRHTMGPRDSDAELEARLSVGTRRLFRALDNHFQGLILFTLAVAVVELGPGSGTLTTALAALYLAARILYVPAYYYGWVPWRSVIWLLGFAATMLMLIAALATSLFTLAPG